MESTRCVVKCLAEFGDCYSRSARIIQDKTSLYVSLGNNNVLIFHLQESRITTVLQFEASVKYLALSDETLRLYALTSNGALYCTTLPLQLRSPQPPSSPPVLHSVPEDSIVLKNVNLQAVLIVKNLLVTLSFHQDVWTFDLYEESASAALQKRAHFQVTSVHTWSSGQADEAENDKRDPTLSCIFPYDGSASPRDLKASHFYLEPRLFRLLFGVDASLTSSPVIICGLPDGRICYFSLLVPGCPGRRQRYPVRVLQSLEQPVVFVGTCVSGECGPQCLIALGQKGKLLMVGSKQVNTDGKKAEYIFDEHSVQGPVMCVCSDEKRLYYSSTRDLQTLQLTASSAEESQCRARNSNSLGVCRPSALAGPHFNSDGSVHLWVLLLGGKLLQVTVPDGSDQDNIVRLTSSHAGQRLKDLLASIGNVWERTELMKHKLLERNQSLKRLNQVVNICGLVLESQAKEKRLEPALYCHGDAGWRLMLQKCSLTLTCVLENSSEYSLEHGWTLCVQAHPSCPANADQSCRTYSFPIRKLDSGQKMEVAIPLEGFQGLSLPVSVYCSLTFSLTVLFSPEMMSSQSQSIIQFLAETSAVSVPLNTLTVDWLDALRLEGSFPHPHVAGNFTLREKVQTILSSRRTQNQDSEAASKTRAVLVRVSSDLLKAKLKISATGSRDICSSVLNWFLSKSETGQACVQNPVVNAFGPNGCSVKLLAKEMTLEDFSSDGALKVLEIQVESTSMAAVCGLHHAILRRLEVLLGDTSERPDDGMLLKTQSLCEAVRRAESLYRDLQEAHSQAALENMMKTVQDQSSEVLFRMVLQLRENPLVIL